MPTSTSPKSAEISTRSGNNLKPLSAAALWLGAFFYLFVSCHLHLEYLDDGASAYGAWQVLSGAVPYRDFMIVSTPAHFYALGALFKLFGPHLMVERVWQCAVWAGALLTLYAVIRLYLPAVFCLGAWIMALAFTGRFPHIAGGMPSAFFFAFLSVYLCLSTLQKEDRRGLLWSGACAGAAALFRHDIGVYAALSVFSTLAFCHDPAWRRKGDLRRFLAGILAAVFLPAVYFLIRVPFRTLFFDLVWFQIKVYPLHSFLPYPSLAAGFKAFLAGGMGWGDFLAVSERTYFYYFAPAALIASVLFLVSGWHKRREEGASLLFWPMLLLTVLGMLFLSQARFRADAVHLLPAYLAACPLFACLAYCVHRRGRTVFLFPAVLLFAVFLWPGLWAKFSTLFHPPSPSHLGIERAEKVDVSPRSAEEAREFSDYRQAVEYIRSITRPGERIFVGSVRHDRLCYADPMFYFLAGRPAAGPDPELHRGHATTETVQRAIIAALEKYAVRAVVRRKLLDDRCIEPNESSRAKGSKVLDEYIALYYSLDRSFGGDEVWVRRS